MSNRAYRARLSLTPDELEAVSALVKAGRQANKVAYANTGGAIDERAFWGKLLDKVERARRRGDERDENRFTLPEDSNG